MNITSENIGYASAIITTLLAISIAVGFLVNKQEDGSKNLRPLAITVILLAIVAGGTSAMGMYLGDQVQDELEHYQGHRGPVAMKDHSPLTNGASNNVVNIDTVKVVVVRGSYLQARKGTSPITTNTNNNAVYADTVKVVPGYH